MDLNMLTAKNVAKWMRSLGIISISQDGNIATITYDSNNEEEFPEETILM